MLYLESNLTARLDRFRPKSAVVGEAVMHEGCEFDDLHRMARFALIAAEALEAFGASGDHAARLNLLKGVLEQITIEAIVFVETPRESHRLAATPVETGDDLVVESEPVVKAHERVAKLRRAERVASEVERSVGAS